MLKLALLNACALLTPAETMIPVSATDTPVPEIAATEPIPTQSESILLWVAPALDPELPAGEILATRLAAFEGQSPRLRINLRVKSINGPGGLIEALEAASVAAPNAVPDLLTLSADDLQHAAEFELIETLPEDLIQSEDPGWYDYALPTIRQEGLFYGLPFASEVDILAYRTEEYPEPPRSWTSLLEEPRTFLFPAADLKARFMLAMYLGAGGDLRDDEGNPALDVSIVEQVLSFLASARASSVLPLAVRQYSSPLETWTELKANRAASAMVPMADFLRESDPEMLAAVALPTETGQGVGLAHTWSWAITPSDPLRQELIIELIRWLSDPAFLADLTSTLGYLPVRQDTLASWPEGNAAALASSLVTVTQMEPAHSLRDAVSPGLITAIDAVLGSGEEPALAAQAAVDLINTP